MTREQKHKIREAEEREQEAFLKEMLTRLYPQTDKEKKRPSKTSFGGIASYLFLKRG